MDNRIVAISLVLIIASVAYAAEDWNLGSTSIFTGVNTTNLNATGVSVLAGVNITNLNVTGIFNTTSVNTTNLNISGEFGGAGFNSQSFQNHIKNGNLDFWYAGTSVAPTGWTFSQDGSGGSVAQETSIIHRGTKSAKIIGGTAPTFIYGTLPSYSDYASRTVTLGAWVNTTTANKARLELYDGATGTFSSYHTGGNTWEFLTVSATMRSNLDQVYYQLRVDDTATAYFDGAILVEGSVVPAFTEHPFDMTLDETRFKVGVFTRDISLASGTQAITGVGFKPSGIIFHTWKDNSPGGSWGFDDGTNSNRMQDQQSVAADSWSGTTGDSIEFLVSAGNEYVGHISSLDSDGFTITWTKTGTPTGTINIQYMAFR